MHYVRMVFVGLVVGVLARFFYPGAVQLGLISSAILGIAGSFVAGVAGLLVHSGSVEKPFHPAGIIFSILGAMLLIFLMRSVLHLV